MLYLESYYLILSGLYSYKIIYSLKVKFYKLSYSRYLVLKFPNT